MVALGGGLAVLVAMIALGSAALRRDPDALGGIFLGMFRAGIGTGWFASESTPQIRGLIRPHLAGSLAL
ncbi:MAG: hypothetical protein LC777_02625 [Actinobacteria bacterium]|nr:hypothetical protein [Actinomycetota bacterium]